MLVVIPVKPVGRISVLPQSRLMVFIRGIVDNVVKLVVVFVLPTIRVGNRLRYMSRRTPSLLLCLMQVSLG